MNIINLTNKKFNRWTVINRAENTITGQARWLCECECGNRKVLKSIIIRRGISKSCGCFKIEELSKNRYKHGHSSSTKVTPTYHSWAGMKARCFNPKHKNFNYYGGRGITVCKRWYKFSNFLNDMGVKPHNLSLDRVNNNGNYCLKNCRWATNKQQANNRRKPTLS